MRVLGFLILCLASAGTGAPFVLAQEPGLPSDPLSGRLVFEEKGCLDCHALGGYGGTIGPDLALEHFSGSSADLAAILWNHLPEMNRKYRQVGRERPTFTESEMLNLMGFLYYLRYLGEPGSALRGKALLKEKGCLACHEQDREGVSVAPGFDETETSFSPVTLVQAMWNHIPAMHEEVERLGMEYPLLHGGDISDISAYLSLASAHESRARIAPGNPVDGRNVFEAKHCSACHTVDGSSAKIGPDFRETDLNSSVTEIAGMMWNHGPLMRKHMAAEQVDWPEFFGNEMADLIAYLYFLEFQAEPGDPTAGKSVSIDKGCSTCHRDAATAPAPGFESITHPNSLVGLATLMWNHAADMEDVVLTRNMKWPELDATETRDLYAFLKTHAKED